MGDDMVVRRDKAWKDKRPQHSMPAFKYQNSRHAGLAGAGQNCAAGEHEGQ